MQPALSSVVDLVLHEWLACDKVFTPSSSEDSTFRPITKKPSGQGLKSGEYSCVGAAHCIEALLCLEAQEPSLVAVWHSTAE